MKLTHEFTVPVPVEQAWEVLTDVERIAPCMPGAELTGVNGDTYHGQVKIKVGPITVQYKGAASFAEKDPGARRVVLTASGTDARGQGNATATVTAQMTPRGDDTAVAITTDLSVTGKVAQFGRGVMADVSAKLLGQFVSNLEADVLSPAAAQTVASPVPPGDAAVPSRAAEPVDLLAVAGMPVARRLVPLIAALIVLAGVLAWRRRRHAKERGDPAVAATPGSGPSQWSRAHRTIY